MPKIQSVIPALLLGAVLVSPGVALAQSGSGAASPQAPNMPPPAATVPEKVDPPLNQAPDTTGTLSDQLNRSDGVIKPPTGVDPEIHKSAPAGNTGRMPVIPPPGSPGSSSSVDPK